MQNKSAGNRNLAIRMEKENKKQTGKGKVPILKKSCTLLNPHTGLKNISWTESSNSSYKCFLLLPLQGPDILTCFVVCECLGKRMRKQESGKNQAT